MLSTEIRQFLNVLSLQPAIKNDPVRFNQLLEQFVSVAEERQLVSEVFRSREQYSDNGDVPGYWR